VKQKHWMVWGLKEKFSALPKPCFWTGD
jgi:hypothetical protein